MSVDKKGAFEDGGYIHEKTPFNEDQVDDFDSSKVKFINGDGAAHQDEVHLKVDDGKKKKDNEFCGLSKDELLVFANDPFWVKVRWVLLILFWLAWVGMLASAVLIIVFAPKCPPRPKLDWYEKSAAYQVFPRSYKDFDGDGIGDLEGIHSKLDYLMSLNISTIWLNSIYPSTHFDFGNAVTDFKAINSEYGTMEDFESFLDAAQDKGVRVILDFIPNHTGRNHTWFQKSIAGANDFKDYYVWRNGSGQGLPDDRLNAYGEPAWTYDDTRKQYYLHTYLSEQPDLNLSNKKVVQELLSVLTFWLDKNVDGFYVDSADYLFGSADEKEVMAQSNSTEPSSSMEKNFELIGKFRALLDDYSKEEGRNHPRVLVVDVDGDKEEIANFHKYNGDKGAHIVLNSKLLQLKNGCDAKCVSQLIEDWMTIAPKGMPNTWRTGSSGTSRTASRMGREWTNAVNMLTMTLPGVPIAYYGEEISMTDVDVSFADTRDYRAIQAGESLYASISKDPQRTPMQWTDGMNAGFTSTDDAWLPVADDFREWNVKTQQAHGSGLTNLDVFQHLSALRSEPSMLWGKFDDLTANNNVLVYKRSAQGFDTFLVAINFGDQSVATNLQLKKTIPAEAFIVATTMNFDGRSPAFELGTHVPLNNIKLHPGEGVVVGWPFNPPEPIPI